MCFAECLKKLMQRDRITNYRLAKEVGCSATTVANWIAGKDIMPTYLQKVADFFNVTTDFLLTGEQKENAPAEAEADDEMAELLEEARRRPELRILFSLSKKATPEEVRQTIKIIKALGNNNGDDFG